MPFRCTRCGSCCSRYWITLLPEDAKRIAAFLHTDSREFIRRHAQLYLRLFPAAYAQNQLVVSSAMLPKRLSSRIESAISHLPEHFLALPMLAFKRKEPCTFYSQKQCCLIHPVKPAQCSAFPFISMDANPDFSKTYPFCKALKVFSGKVPKAAIETGRLHYSEISRYFNAVRLKGFSSLWTALPKKGIVSCRQNQIGKISLDEFKSAVAPFL